MVLGIYSVFRYLDAYRFRIPAGARKLATSRCRSQGVERQDGDCARGCFP